MNLHQSGAFASQESHAVSVEAGGEQGSLRLRFFAVEDSPQTYVADEAVRINEAAAGAVVEARRGRWLFRLWCGGRDESGQIGQGIVDMHGRVPFY